MLIENRFVGLLALALAGLAGCGDDPAAADGGGAGTADATPGGEDADADAAVPGDCPEAAAFLDVGGAPGAGNGYAAPRLGVSCTEASLVVTGNGIPPYTFVPITPNALVENDYTFTLPRHPALASTPTDIATRFGSVGVAVNGLVFYAAMEGAQPAAEAFGDPIYNGIMDACLGHTSRAEYHYHALLQQCLAQTNLVARPWESAAPSADQRSPVLAYAFDGFPVYGPYECTDAGCTDVVEMKSSWDQVGDPTTNAWTAYQYSAKAGAEYLDRCNGHVGPEGDYHYHSTSGFPYTIGCYMGTPGATGGGGGGGGGTPPSCTPGQTMCCGDGVCGGPETSTNCAADCP